MTFPHPGHRHLYRIGAAVFDGTNDYMARGADPTGIADGKLGTWSTWIKSGGDGTTQLIAGSNQAFSTIKYGFKKAANNGLTVNGRNAASTSILAVSTAINAITNDGLWHNILISYDLGAGACKIYIDDADATSVVTTLTNDTIDYTTGNMFIGADSAAASKLNATLAALWFNPTYLDLTVTANRRLFIDASKKPVYLGANGERPLGSTPLVYQKVPLGGVATDFATNQGSGGNFTITGSLDLAPGPTG